MALIRSYDIIQQFGYDERMSKASFTKKLFISYANELTRFVAKKFSHVDDPEDIVQDAFHNFLNVPSPESLENPRAYLYQTAQNLVLNRIRKNKHHDAYLSNMEESALEEQRSPERSIAGQQDLEAMNTALEGLNEKCRNAFIMHRLDGYSYKQIADELSVSVSSVEKYLMKAMAHIRENME